MYFCVSFYNSMYLSIYCSHFIFVILKEGISKSAPYYDFYFIFCFVFCLSRERRCSEPLHVMPHGFDSDSLIDGPESNGAGLKAKGFGLVEGEK